MIQDEIDWPGIKAAAAVIGVREACRRVCDSANLTSESASRLTHRIRRRATREKWYVPDPKSNAKKDIKTQLLSNSLVKPLDTKLEPKKVAKAIENGIENVSVANVASVIPTGAQVIQERLEEDSRETRLDLAKAARKGAKHLAETDGIEIVESAGKMRDIAMVAEKVHGWDSQAIRPAISLTFIGSQMPDKMANGTVIDV